MFQEFLFKIVGLLGSWTLRLLGSTWRTVEIPGAFARDLHSGRTIGVHGIWHRSQVAVSLSYHKKKVAVLASKHSDAEYMVRVLRTLCPDFRVARGSTTRGGREGLRQLQQLVAEGYPAVLTPDGPKGPRYSMKSGLIVLAQRTGVPVVVTAVAAWPAWVMPSWDRFMIPKPFAKIFIIHSAPRMIPPDASRDEIERTRAELEAELRELTQQAQTEVRKLHGPVLKDASTC